MANEKKFRVLIDMDGVLCDWEPTFLKTYKEKWPGRPFIPLEERKEFLVRNDYKNQLGITNPNEVYEEEGWFLNLPPVEGAVEAFEYLNSREDIEVVICSAPITNYKFCVTEKYQWVEKHLGKKAVSQLMLTKDKTIVRGDLLIDDKPLIKGLDSPSWFHALFTAAHNTWVSDLSSNQRRMDSWNIKWLDELITDLKARNKN